jgi:hypothetical protein
MPPTMHTGLLPDWLRVIWITALCVVAAVHVRHVWVMRGQHRYWHGGHVLMAAGMAYMYLPHTAHVLPGAGAMAVFAVVAGVSIIAASALWWREGMLNPLWILTVLETAVMVYIFTPANARSVVLNSTLAGYLVGVGLLWAAGRWDRHYLAPRPRRPAAHRRIRTL